MSGWCFSLARNTELKVPENIWQFLTDGVWTVVGMMCFRANNSGMSGWCFSLARNTELKVPESIFLV